MGAHHLQHVANTAGLMIVARRGEDAPRTHDVVHDDHRSRPAQLDRPAQVGAVVLLVGVDEHQIEITAQPGQCLQCGADDDLDPVGDSGAAHVLRGDLGVAGVVLESHHTALGSDSAGQTDRRVPGQRADLQSPACATDAGQQIQQARTLRGDLDRRQTRGLRVGEGSTQGRVLPEEQAVEQCVGGQPLAGPD